jgi:hypothetical protein
LKSYADDKRKLWRYRIVEQFCPAIIIYLKCESLDLDFEKLITFFKHINLKQISGNKNQNIVIPYLLSYEIEILKKAVSLQKILQTIKFFYCLYDNI